MVQVKVLVLNDLLSINPPENWPLMPNGHRIKSNSWLFTEGQVYQMPYRNVVGVYWPLPKAETVVSPYVYWV